MAQTFNHIGEYNCICGKCYTNSQAFVGHKARCKVYQQQKRGEAYQEWANEYKDKLDDAARKTTKRLSEEAHQRNIEKEQRWLAEGHYCEKCGKLITKKFGTGRFCSQSCANSHKWDSEGKEKISAKLKEFYKNNPDKVHSGWTPLSLDKAISTRKRNREAKRLEESNYLSGILPAIVDEVQNRKSGFQSRTIKYSYPEQFWRSVFENNGVQYEHSVYINNGVHTKGAAAYELDFLIDGKYDIEIDGGTHTKFEDVKKKDIRRDAYLTSLGYIVYRIPWINPISIEKKDQVYQQIVDLFNFLGKELITKRN